MNNKLYQYLRIKFAADADPDTTDRPWYKQIGHDLYDTGASLVSSLGGAIRQGANTTNVNEAATRQLNNDMYNQAIAALQRGEDPGYNPYAGSHISSMGGNAAELAGNYEEALAEQEQQQQQQNNQPVINVNLPEGYGGGGGGSQGGGYAGPQQGPSLADRIMSYSGKAGY